MKRTAYLGLDLGGTGAKAGVFDADAGQFAFLSQCCNAFYRRDRACVPDPVRQGLYEVPYGRHLELRARLYG